MGIFYQGKWPDKLHVKPAFGPPAIGILYQHFVPILGFNDFKAFWRAGVEEIPFLDLKKK